MSPYLPSDDKASFRTFLLADDEAKSFPQQFNFAVAIAHLRLVLVAMRQSQACMLRRLTLALPANALLKPSRA
ncbi:hypothetical protein T09_12807 [Trichinella sp. T9]|nr:hypothetical protein T09_12807 [Trichinella sp. T9]